jgi:Putative transposase DNA-binding domain
MSLAGNQAKQLLLQMGRRTTGRALRSRISVSLDRHRPCIVFYFEVDKEHLKLSPYSHRDTSQRTIRGKISTGVHPHFRKRRVALYVLPGREHGSRDPQSRGRDWWFASSKLCHCCGWTYEGLTLKERQWTRKGRGTRHDRDENAAVDFRDYARHIAVSSTVTAGGGDGSGRRRKRR